jgi:hypothetical protein
LRRRPAAAPGRPVGRWLARSAGGAARGGLHRAEVFSLPALAVRAAMP